MAHNTELLPGQHRSGQQATLGVVGGGQLGRMFVQAAQQMGFYTAVLDPDPSSPAGGVSHYHIQTDYLDEQGLAQLMQRASAITTEFENVPAKALVTLAGHRTVAPGARAVAIAQDRIQEKAHFTLCGVPCAPYAVIETAADIEAVPKNLFPGLLKTARLGYDGKGQKSVADASQLGEAWAQLGQVPCVLEQRLPLLMECSVIVARGHDGAMVHFPVQNNLHRDGILAVTQVFEGAVPASTAAKAVDWARAVAQGLDYVGVLCVEFFVVASGLDGQAPGPAQLVVNEMAPRPHNSGHYSLDACDQSQFDLQVKTLAGLPLVPVRQHSPAVMLNLLGDLWFKGQSVDKGQAKAQTPDWAKCLALPGTHLHLYGKLDPRPGRKMGHLTITGATAADVTRTAQAVCAVLGIEAF
jgi:5-(carboxyamino)imidazole ribonucleotide synthase